MEHYLKVIIFILLFELVQSHHLVTNVYYFHRLLIHVLVSICFIIISVKFQPWLVQ